jgi:hypothetical protein
MPRLIAATVCLVLCAPAADAFARAPHHHHGHVDHPDGFATIHTRSGQTAVVAASAATPFKGFLGWLEAKGYKIGTLGCYNYRNIRGTNRLSQHAFGRACDVNQVARNEVVRPFPPGTAEVAARFGLVAGSQWHHPDTGHFELARPGRPTEVARANSRAADMIASLEVNRVYRKPCKAIGPECFQ